MDYNRNGGKKPDSVSPLSQSADDLVSSFQEVLDSPFFVGLSEFDKADWDSKDTILVQVRQRAWYVKTESGMEVKDDESNVLIVLEDSLPTNQNLKELTGQQHAQIGERLTSVLQRFADGWEVCTLQFRILARRKRIAPPNSLN